MANSFAELQETVVADEAGAAWGGAAPYAVGIFASASLLFLIQPIVAKQFLPWFGGAATLWTACMVFFQCLLLLGYLYAHASIRFLRAKGQASVHIVLLAISLITFLPIAEYSPRATASHPIWECLRLLAGGIGLPYFILSSTTPLLQAWYTRRSRTALPYRLFALSNLASLAALLAYPSLMEPFTDLRTQVTIWRCVYLGFALVCGFLAIRVFRKPGDSRVDPAGTAGDFRWRTGSTLGWILLAACSSSLLLAVTNNLSQNLAPVPLLWIAPLAVYLFSFVLCFDQEGRYRPAAYRLLLPAALVGLLWLCSSGINVAARVAVPACLACLFVACVFCHGQLAAMKPASRDLTLFYLCLAVGGALGGVFVGLLAPMIFSDFFELQIAISVCLVLALRFLFGYRSRAFLLVCLVVAVTALRTAANTEDGATGVYAGRNFYGALRVRDTPTAANGGSVRVMLHGNVIHGGQVLTPVSARRDPRYYYGPNSGIGLVLRRPSAGRRVGIIGLGTGTLVAYGSPADYYRFYELNPLVAELARSRFTYLRDARAKVDVVLGDARLSLDREPVGHFDTLVLDAFSGDAIPVHLLTEEAFRCYFRHLNGNGVLAVHVSNDHLDLRPVVAGVAAAFGRRALFVESPAESDRQVSHAAWILVSADHAFIESATREAGGVTLLPPAGRWWTDQYSNILSILR